MAATLVFALLFIVVLATALVTCDGTGTEIQSNLWGLPNEGTSNFVTYVGPTLQDRKDVWSGGPDLLRNGDFSFDSTGALQDAITTASGLTPLSTGSGLPGVYYRPYVGLQYWTVTGGGTYMQ